MHRLLFVANRFLQEGGSKSGAAPGELDDAQVEMVVLRQEDSDACLFLDGRGREVQVDAEGEEGVLLPARDEGLTSRAGVIAVVSGEVESGRGQADRARPFRRGDCVRGGDGEAPVCEVSGEGGFGVEGEGFRGVGVDVGPEARVRTWRWC
jgi:hypothetical protein